MPHTWKTKARSIRVPDLRWETFLANTRRRGETASGVLNRAIEEYNVAADLQRLVKPEETP